MNPDFASSYNRSADWKWHRAVSIVDGTGVVSTPFWDTEKGHAWITRAADFYRAYQREPSPVLNEDLILLYGDIYTAYSMYTDRSSYFRQELEALILARVETQDLAWSIDAPLAAMIAYEELFFDVRGKLENESYIVHFVIGPEIQNLKDDSYGPLWKLLGYYQGPEMVRALVSRTVNPQFCMTPDAVGARLNEDITGAFKLACEVASKKKGCGNNRDLRLLQLFAKVMEVDKMEDFSSGSSKGQIAEHVNAMLSTLKLSVGEGGTEHSGEPQFSEQVELAVQGTSDTFNPDFKFPKPV